MSIVVLACAVLMAACGDEGDSGERAVPSGPADVVLRLELEEGEAIGGPGSWRVEVGDLVEIRVRSDAREELHVHGYDVLEPIGPDTEAKLRFVADTPGVFEVELEQAGTPVADLAVYPAGSGDE